MSIIQIPPLCSRTTACVSPVGRVPPVRIAAHTGPAPIRVRMPAPIPTSACVSMGRVIQASYATTQPSSSPVWTPDLESPCLCPYLSLWGIQHCKNLDRVKTSTDGLPKKYKTKYSQDLNNVQLVHQNLLNSGQKLCVQSRNCKFSKCMLFIQWSE